MGKPRALIQQTIVYKVIAGAIGLDVEGFSRRLILTKAHSAIPTIGPWPLVSCRLPANRIMDWLVSNANRQHRLVLKQNDSRWGISAKARWKHRSTRTWPTNQSACRGFARPKPMITNTKAIKLVFLRQGLA